MAAQLTAIKGFALRRAMLVQRAGDKFLAVPVSPRIRTVASLSAASPIVFCTRRMAALVPISVPVSLASSALLADLLAAAPLQKPVELHRPIGLVRWSNAPSRIASIVFSAVANAVSTMTGGASSPSPMRRRNSMPSIPPGMRRSSSTHRFRSGRWGLAAGSATRGT